MKTATIAPAVVSADAKEVWTRRITYGLTLFMRWFSAHWLLMANLAVGLYISLPLLAPVLVHAGHERLGNLVYLMFRPLCHQLPERSFFLYGGKCVYSYEELGQLTGGLVPDRFLGSEGIGFKTAVCQRCLAIYPVMLIGGLLFAWLRKRLRFLPLKAFAIMVFPLAVDGLGQLFGLWTSTWWSRLLTGGLFGLSCVWLGYPYLERGMREVHSEAEKTLAALEN